MHAGRCRLAGPVVVVVVVDDQARMMTGVDDFLLKRHLLATNRTAWSLEDHLRSHVINHVSRNEINNAQHKVLTTVQQYSPGGATSQPAYLHTLLHHYTPRCTLRFSSTCRDFQLNLVKYRLVTRLLQSGMDYLLTSDFHPLLTPSENSPFQLAHQHPHHAAT